MELDVEEVLTLRELDWVRIGRYLLKMIGYTWHWSDRRVIRTIEYRIAPGDKTKLKLIFGLQSIKLELA